MKTFFNHSLVVGLCCLPLSLFAGAGVLRSTDKILGERESGGGKPGYYPDDPIGLVGTSGKGGSRTDSNVVFGFTLPTLPAGQKVRSATFTFEITGACDQSLGGIPDLHVYLLKTKDPNGSDTAYFYHGPRVGSSTAIFVGATATEVKGGSQHTYKDGMEVRTFALAGDALAHLQGFYGGDHIPEQTEVFFRFNLDANPDEKAPNSLVRYTINTAAGKSAFEINPSSTFLIDNPLITYVDAVSGDGGNTFATDGSPSKTSWLSGADSSNADESRWVIRKQAEANSGALFQALHDVRDGDDMPELTTRISGLAEGHYTIWAFYWDQLVSDTQNWTLSAGLTSRHLKTYSSPGQPKVRGATTEDVFDASELNFATDVKVMAGQEKKEVSQLLFGVKLGEVSVLGGDSSVNVFVDNLVGNGSLNRTWYDGVGYAPVSAPFGSKRIIRSFTSLGNDVWEFTLKGAPNSGYFLFWSEDPKSVAGIYMGEFFQGSSTDPGSVGGPDNDVVMTDENGDAMIRLTLNGAPATFVRAEIIP